MKKLVILGGGPGGYEMALEASHLDYQVTLIDAHKVGGTCLHYGCIPTKTHYKHAKLLKSIREASDLGVNVNLESVDYQVMKDRQLSVSETLYKGIEKSLKKQGVIFIEGFGYFEGDHLYVKHADQEVTEVVYDELVIATGSTPKKLPIEGANLPLVYDSSQLLALNHIPNSMTIIGAGVIGMEFASIWNQLGTKVTVVEYCKDILPSIDTAISKRLAAYCKKQGITINTQSEVLSIESRDDLALTNFKNKKGDIIEVESEIVLMAVGRQANISHYGLETTDISIEQGAIAVDECYKTTKDHIYAIGDVINKGQLAHLATYQGKQVLKSLSGSGNSDNHQLVPGAIFTFPEIATIGITEDQAKERQLEYTVKKTMFGAVGKAHALNETDGFMKVILDPDKQILGVHILGPEASIIIHEAALAIKHHITYESLCEMIHIHPSLSEIYIV